MNESIDESAPFHPVYGVNVIGAVVEALNIKEGLLKNRTARRFYSGKSVSEHSRKEILGDLGKSLIELGIVPSSPLLEKYSVSTATVVSDTIFMAVGRWDRLQAVMQSRSSRILDLHVLTLRFLRLLTVDLSLRIFALLRLSGLEPSPPHTPLWAEENGGGKFLRLLAANVGLSRHQLAARVGVSYASVDNWLDGKNQPEPKHLAALAYVLAPVGVESSQLVVTLKRHFTFACICDLLAPWIGREQVLDLASALSRFVYRISEDVRLMDRPPIEEAAGSELTALRFGTTHPSTHVLLRNLALVEEDEDWKRDILAATVPWEIRFQVEGIQAGGGRSAAGLAQEVLDEFPCDPAHEALQELVEENLESIDQRALERSPMLIVELFDKGMASRKRIVRDFPLSPRAHLELGSFMGMAGKCLMSRDLVDEAILECKLAAHLLPNWDTPAVEVGIMLANIGEYEEAMNELNWARDHLGQLTPHLQINMGHVLMRLGRFESALEQFEQVISSRPDYALAHLHAAKCAFALGDKVRGLRYSKRARQLGEPGEFVAWKSGLYSSRRKRSAR